MKNILNTSSEENNFSIGEVKEEEAEKLLSDISNETTTTVVVGPQAEGMNTLNLHFYKKQKIINDVQQGKKVIVLDPENEYRKLAEALGAEIRGQKEIFNLFNCNEGVLIGLSNENHEVKFDEFRNDNKFCNKAKIGTMGAGKSVTLK